jgi:hypothetical protein
VGGNTVPTAARFVNALKPTTVEVRLDQHKAASFGPAGPSILPFWLSRVGCDRISLPRNPQDGRSRPTTSVSGKCRSTCPVSKKFLRRRNKPRLLESWRLGEYVNQARRAMVLSRRDRGRRCIRTLEIEGM